MSPTETASPGTSLVNLILTLLAPMFLWSTCGDIRLAHIAAAQTLHEYRVTNRLSLFTVAKIIAFDIATLSSLSLSMYEDVSMQLALRLRGNANSLDRSGERNRRALEAARVSVPDGVTEGPVEGLIDQAEQIVRDAKTRMHAERPAEPEPVAVPVPPAGVSAPDDATPAARIPAQQQPAAWPDAMTAVAEEFAAGLDDIPPDERWKEMARIMTLTTAAADLASGAPPPPVAAIPAQ